VSATSARGLGFADEGRIGHVAVVGEALVDLIISGPTPGDVEAHIGGGPFNTARALARLGVATSYLGRVSTDVFGARIRAQLAADGVNAAGIVDTDQPTTLAQAELRDGAASYRFYLDGTSVPGCSVDDAGAALRRIEASTDRPLDALHVGTLALVLEPFATATESVIGTVRARSRDTLLYVDPNIRTSVMTDPEVVRARLARVLSHASVVKVSDDDLRWIAPDRDLDDAARALLNDSTGTVLLTRGGEGATVFTRSGSTHVPAPTVSVVDTVGAGDSFSGGVLAWWLANGRPDLADAEVAVAAARHGVAVAAVVVGRAGANPPFADEL
jgi:fructokinase